MTIGEFGFDFAYVTDEDRAEYRNFCVHHLRSYGRPLVDEVWHYTSADGLIAILQSSGRSAHCSRDTCLSTLRLTLTAQEGCRFLAFASARALLRASLGSASPTFS